MELTYDCALDIMLYLDDNLKTKSVIYSLQLIKALNMYSEVQVIQSISQLLNSGYISAQVSEGINSTAYNITNITTAGYEFINNH